MNTSTTTKTKTNTKSKAQLSITNYNYDSWIKKFPKYDIDFSKLHIHSSWKKIFEKEFKEEYFEELEEYLSVYLKKKKKENDLEIFPHPDLVFNAFNSCPLDKIKVIILGQDPYHDYEKHDSVIVCQAMGLSFSVPIGIPVPSSLRNIYKNQKKFGLIEDIPKHGNLSKWAKQGCLMLNSALTVRHKKPNIHQNYWKPFTNAIIEHVSEKCDNVVFLLWGRNAYDKRHLIDEDKHKIIHSTHPSGLSFSKDAKYGQAFIKVDHFSECNAYLIEHGKKPIKWSLFDDNTF